MDALGTDETAAPTLFHRAASGTWAGDRPAAVTGTPITRPPAAPSRTKRSAGSPARRPRVRRGWSRGSPHPFGALTNRTGRWFVGGGFLEEWAGGRGDSTPGQRSGDDEAAAVSARAGSAGSARRRSTIFSERRAQRRGFGEYPAGLLLPRDRNRTLPCLAGCRTGGRCPASGGAAAAVLPLRSRPGIRKRSTPAARNHCGPTRPSPRTRAACWWPTTPGPYGRGSNRVRGQVVPRLGRQVGPTVPVFPRAVPRPCLPVSAAVLRTGFPR